MTLSHLEHPDAIATLDAAGVLAVCTWTLRAGEAHLSGCNPAFESLLGYAHGSLDRREAAAPLTWRELTGGGSAAPAHAGMLDFAGERPAPAEYTLKGHDGHTAVALVSTVPGPQPGQLVSLCVDVTQQAAARRDAEQASVAKSRFLSVVSHELRTPLNAIHGQVELLREGVYGEPTEAQRKALDRVQRAEAKLKAVIDDVLTFSRLETGQVTYDVRRLSLREVLGDVTDAVASQCAAKRQAITVKLPEDDVIVAADEEKLHTALLALVSNASKFTPPEGHITIDTALRAEVADFLFIRVTDTGAGIPRDHFESIFSPFAQVDERGARTAEGLGLGLTIARDLVRGMGGDIRVRSRGGSGATFTLAVRRQTMA